MMENILIFIKETEKENLDLPEVCEGIYCPMKFDIKEYDKWKSREKKSYLEGEESIIDSVFNIIDKSFSSKTDYKFMIYSRFLTDPRDMETGHSLIDSNARFGNSSYCEIWKQFMVLFRSCLYNNGNVCLVPDKIVKELSKTFDLKEKTETQLNYDNLPKDLWKLMYSWKVVRNFITNRSALFPKIEDLLKVYGSPENKGIFKDLTTFDGCFVDVIDKEDSEKIVPVLQEKFNIEYFQV